MVLELSEGFGAGANDAIAKVVIAYDTLLISGFFISTTVFLTAALSKRIVRSFQWFIFMGFASWWSIQYLLLVGNQTTSTPPPRTLCLIQSASHYAAPSGTSFGLLALFYQIFLLLVECLENKAQSGSFLSSAVIATPFMVYIGVFVAGITVVRDELRVTCHFTGGTMAIVEAGAITLACLAIFILEGLIMVKIWKNHSRLRIFNGKSTTKHFSLSLVIRASAFSLLPVSGIIVSGVTMVRGYKDERTSTPAVNIFLSSIPLFAGILFGTQKDIIDVWRFWKRPKTSMLGTTQKLPYGKV
ncbi:hypothetical protein DL96DRAFT_876428 [Flagelloscypha sp. PMI_526]|nr:hypothetical protein DL96DRAFT_876428 [Flagelloscypha sp. PMI_526]